MLIYFQLLYDHDVETDNLALLQSLLLMSHWCEGPDDAKGPWHWIGIAMSLAQSIGLNKDPEKQPNGVTSRKHAKRVWWSCVVRDRLIALGLSKQTKTMDTDHNVPMLTLDDFEIGPLPIANDIFPPYCIVTQDTEIQRQLALLFIEKAKLCVCIGHILTTQYTSLSNEQESTHHKESKIRSGVMLFPKGVRQLDAVRSCDLELTNWIESLPESCLYKQAAASDITKGYSALFVHRAFLHMIYFTATSALFRQYANPSTTKRVIPEEKQLQGISLKRLYEGSNAVALISQNLHELNLDCYLPPAGVTALIPALITQVIAMRSRSGQALHARLMCFYHCMIVLDTLQGIYVSADFSIALLDAVIQKANIELDADSTLNAPGLLASHIGYGIYIDEPCKIIQNNADLMRASLQIISMPSGDWEKTSDEDIPDISAAPKIITALRDKKSPSFANNSLIDRPDFEEINSNHQSYDLGQDMANFDYYNLSQNEMVDFGHTELYVDLARQAPKDISVGLSGYPSRLPESFGSTLDPADFDSLELWNWIDLGGQ